MLFIGSCYIILNNLFKMMKKLDHPFPLGKLYLRETKVKNIFISALITSWDLIPRILTHCFGTDLIPEMIGRLQITDTSTPITVSRKSDTVCTRTCIETHRLRCNFLFLSKIGLSSLSFPSLRFGAQGVVPSSFPFSENYFTLHLWLSSDLNTDSIFRLFLMGQLMTIFPLSSNSRTPMCDYLISCEMYIFYFNLSNLRGGILEKFSLRICIRN